MRNACREKYQFVKCFFHFIEMLSKSFFKFTLSLANILSMLAKLNVNLKKDFGTISIL